MAICWLGYRYFPERFEAWDAVPYGVMIGLFGIGRVLDWIAKRYGLDKVEKKNEATVASFEEVKEVIRRNLLQQKQNSVYTKEIQNLKEKYVEK